MQKVCGHRSPKELACNTLSHPPLYHLHTECYQVLTHTTWATRWSAPLLVLELTGKGRC
jgi:hypothetical protein